MTAPTGGADGITLVDTPIGWCGLAWTGRGIVAVHLPERDRATTVSRLRRRVGGALELPPPPVVTDAARRILTVLDGARDDLRDVVLDLSGVTSFEASVYAVARTIAPGATLTYGEVAALVGSPGLARAVGQAMGHNPCPLVVPCHRVLAAHGALGGFSAHGGTVTKRRLLFLEGALPAEQRSLFDA